MAETGEKVDELEIIGGGFRITEAGVQIRFSTDSVKPKMRGQTRKFSVTEKPKTGSFPKKRTKILTKTENRKFFRKAENRNFLEKKKTKIENFQKSRKPKILRKSENQ